MLTRADIDQVRIWAGCAFPGTVDKAAVILGITIIVLVWVFGVIQFIIYWPTFERRVEGAMKGWKEAVEVDEERGEESEGVVQSSGGSENGSSLSVKELPDGGDRGEAEPPVYFCTIM